MIEDKKVFKNQDLVLKVSPNIDPEKFDINESFRSLLLNKKREKKSNMSFMAL